MKTLYPVLFWPLITAIINRLFGARFGKKLSAGLACASVLTAFGFANRFKLAEALAPAAKADAAPLAVGNIEALARLLYRGYLPAFELTGILLLVAVVGIMVMAKRKLD